MPISSLESENTSLFPINSWHNESSHSSFSHRLLPCLLAWLTLPQSLVKNLLVRILVVVALVVVPIVLVLASFNSPIWSFQSPSAWDRPQFYYGCPLPIKRDGHVVFPLVIAIVNWIFWTLYLQWVLGSRRLKHYVITFSIALVLSCLGVWWCGGSAFNSVSRVRTPKATTSEATP